MENYIVRVYRRDIDEPEAIAGLVETVGAAERTPFKTVSELVTIIRQVIGKPVPAVSKVLDHPHILVAHSRKFKKQAS